jgi:hypothetical protein
MAQALRRRRICFAYGSKARYGQHGFDPRAARASLQGRPIMLVHGRNEEFPYKTPAARQIKAAFAAMRAKAAST